MTDPAPDDTGGMDRGEVAHLLGAAAAKGQQFEDAGVPDAPANRAMWAAIQADIANLPEGVGPDIAWDPDLPDN